MLILIRKTTNLKKKDNILPTPLDAPLDSTKNTNTVFEGRDNLRGISWMLVSVLAASLMTVSVRYVSIELDTGIVVLYRSAISVMLIGLAVILFSPLRKSLSFTKPYQHLIRGFLIAMATHFGFYTIANIPLATASVLFFTAPIFATVLGVFFHNEPVGPRRVFAIVAGFIGALIVLRPGFSEFHIGMVTAICSSLFFASALTMSRKLAQADGALSAYFSSVVITALFSLPFLSSGASVPVENLTWIALFMLVITGMARGFADIQAYRHSDASVLAPVAYLRLVFVGLAGFLLFYERPDWPTYLGATIIIGSSLYITYRERSKKAK